MPITLPITRANWPARYFGAPDPLSTPGDVEAAADIDEAARRLGALQLAAEFSASDQVDALARLRGELDRLVQDFPAQPLSAAPLQDPAAGHQAPNLSLNLMQQLLLLGIDPYFARVLGLYFVDTDADPDVIYEYCVIGNWGDTPCPPRVAVPGLAPAALLARGKTQSDGMTIAPGVSTSSLWRWTRDDAQGVLRPQIDPGAPSSVGMPITAALAELAPTAQPEGLLAVLSEGTSAFPFFVPPPVATIGLDQLWPRVEVQVSGTGAITANSGGHELVTVSFASSPLTAVTLTAPDPETALIDQLVFIGSPAAGPGTTSTIVVGEIRLYRLPTDPVGNQIAGVVASSPIVPIPPPSEPVTTFRYRDADVDAATLALNPRSFYDIEWAAPDAGSTPRSGHPVTDPANLPPPASAVGFVVDRTDSGAPVTITRLPRRALAASAPRPKGSRLTSSRVYRGVDSPVPDPVGVGRTA